MAKDEVFVNVKSTNLWDEVYETGGLYASDGTDWATSDRIRDQLKALGVQIKDTKDGCEWTIE